MTALNVTAATTAELLAFFNSHTGGAQVKKFADRKTAERRVNLLIAEMIEDGDTEGYELTAAEQAIVDAPAGSSEHLTQELACPECGCTQDITAGRIVNRKGHQVLVDEDVFTCHPCGHEWGTPDAPAKASVSTGLTRPEMTASLKLDRAIQEVTTGHIYANACQVWKAGLVSSAQCDRLSATLYGAAKAGNRLMSVTVNGHVFTLANKA